MSFMYTNRKTFEKVKKFLEENQYSFKVQISNNQFFIRVYPD